MIIIKQIITENSEILFIVLSLSLSLVLIFPFLFSGSFFLFLHLYLLQFNLSQISSVDKGKEATATSTIPLPSFPRLSFFSFWECPNLTSVPEGMSQLTSLQTLHICGCPRLEQRCEKENGEDWANISHFPGMFFTLL